MVVNDTRIYQKMKNKRLFNIKRNVMKLGKNAFL